VRGGGTSPRRGHPGGDSKSTPRGHEKKKRQEGEKFGNARIVQESALKNSRGENRFNLIGKRGDCVRKEGDLGLGLLLLTKKKKANALVMGKEERQKNISLGGTGNLFSGVDMFSCTDKKCRRGRKKEDGRWLMKGTGDTLLKKKGWVERKRTSEKKKGQAQNN